jgi:hypothetical protein
LLESRTSFTRNGYVQDDGSLEIERDCDAIGRENDKVVHLHTHFSATVNFSTKLFVAIAFFVGDANEV